MDYNWNVAKNLQLKTERGVSFEQVVYSIEQGLLRDIITHPNHDKYHNQYILLVQMKSYIWAVPFVKEGEHTWFLKTIIPSRKYTKRYMGVDNDTDES